MGDAIDLTGDEGVVKTIVSQAKADAIAPTEDLPLVDGIHLLLKFTSWGIKLSSNSLNQKIYNYHSILICFEQFIMKAFLLKMVKFLILHTKIILYSRLSLERVL